MASNPLGGCLWTSSRARERTSSVRSVRTYARQLDSNCRERNACGLPTKMHELRCPVSPSKNIGEVQVQGGEERRVERAGGGDNGFDTIAGVGP